MTFFARVRRHPVLRAVRFAVTVAVAALAAALVCALTLDIGPALRGLAERQGSKQLKRPIHLGHLSIQLFRGLVRIDDLVIEGLAPTDRPFFHAAHLSIGLDWSTLLGREVTISSVEMTDWQMLVEKWEDRHNFPKFGSDEPEQPDKPKRFTTTLKYLRASKGQFTYDDHEKPWSTVARNLDLTITNLPTYNGTAVFTGGTVAIQDYAPMWANMRARFTIDHGLVHLSRIDLETDGAESVAVGDVDLGRWPEQTYQVQSRVHFPRMREIFFAQEKWRLTGDGDFTGTFHLFKGGHDLHGTFSSALAGVNDYRFPDLYGSLRWTPAAFEVWDAGSRFSGGAARFTYAIKPLGVPERPTQRFDASYQGVDVAAFTDFQRLPGLRFSGRASGQNVLEWPSGHFDQHRGQGRVVVTPPAGIVVMKPVLDGSVPPRQNIAERHGRDADTIAPLPSHLPIAGELSYRFGPRTVELGDGQFVTEKTHVAFQGVSAWGDNSRIAFHVTSADWQESDQVLAGIITDFGHRTGAVPFGGSGEFDGVMTGPFNRPRVEGEFSGSDLWAWDTTWGSGTAHLVVDNSYVDITDGDIRLGDSDIRTDGRFSLGYPRDDNGEEINARFSVVRRDVASLRHAFQIDDYPVDGLLTGEFHLTGQYQHPIGFGGMTVDNGTAYSEPFQRATASLRFDGTGVRLDGIDIAKGDGSVTGAAYVGWDGTYSFNADGRRIPVEQIKALSYPQTPLSGMAQFSAGGSGTFEQPRYSVRFRVDDLFIAEEGVGQVTASIALRSKEMTGEFEAASPRLAITGAGRIALTDTADADITLRFHDSSLDPYVRLFVPKLSPFTTAVANGAIHVVGQLTNVDRLVVEATVDSVELKLFDYALRNDAPIRIALDQHDVKVRNLELIGEDTRLRVTGTVGLHDERIALQASGDANLGILQGFFRNLRSAGRAELTAAVNGPLREPIFSGNAVITNGRIRHFSLPNSLDSINGTIYFDARGIRLDDVTASMGGGRVQFGGRIGLEGYMPGELNVTARGDDMRLRYPEGVRSVVDADLVLRGNVMAPVIGGTVTVKSAMWTKRLEAPGSILDLTRGRSGGGGGAAAAPAVPAEPTVPLRFDVRVLVPSTLRIENNLARMVASADLTLSGTYDRPVLFGHADIDRGEVTFEGRRYRVTRGVITFTNPTRMEPFFDVEAETVVRVPGQTYRVTVSAAGTPDRLSPSLNSDPPLPAGDVLALLLGSSGAPGDAELRAIQNPTERQTDILTTRATQALTSPISSEVGRVVEQTFGVDTFQLSPSLFDPYTGQSGRVNPSARVTIGKRISDRVYLTFSRSLNSAVYDQIVLLEYDATDRLSWILSRNEDQTYAIEFRVRHTF